MIYLMNLSLRASAKFLAAIKVFFMSEAIVIGPQPPNSKL
jgi:hypothetical protein